jgi:DNA-damage-inducible protein D
MDSREIEKKSNETFGSIRKVAGNGQEFWSARELQPLLEYSSWDKFKRVISKAMTACEKSGQAVENHFSQVGKMVDLGSGASRE